MIQVTPAMFGNDAALALREAISRAKGSDPLIPVTVLVPTNYVGVSIRRQLASGNLGQITPASRGIAGVDFLTPFRIAELLGGSSLAASGKRPVSNPVVAAVVRRTLANDPGQFAGVEEHPSTERALVRLHRELRDLSPDQLEQLVAANHQCEDVIRIHRQVDVALGDQWYDEFDLMREATEVLRRQPHLIAERGHTILYLLQTLSLTASAMLREVGAQGEVTVLAGMTGVDRADSRTSQICERLGVTLTPIDGSTPNAHRIVTVSDADDEVRSLIREITTAARQGVALERMAVLYSRDEPYARLLDEHLNAAEVPRNGESVRSVAESLVGRLALGLLALPDGSFRRGEVLGVLASAPIRQFADTRQLTPNEAWERVSRSAGVIRGTNEWRTRLGQYESDCQVEVEHLEGLEPDSMRISRLKREIDLTQSLTVFFAELADNLDQTHSSTTWTSIAEWLRSLLTRYLGPTAQRDGWPETEVTASDQVDAALRRLSGLDAVEPQTSLGVFRRTLELELKAGVGRVGTFGNGVFVGRVGQALGLDMDRVFVLGMAEGTFPAQRSEDNLLPDNERATLDGALPLRGSSVEDEHRLYLAALASASGERVLFFPRGDLRRSNERVPSRWLLDSATALAGERVDSETLSGLARDDTVEWVREVPSFIAGIRNTTFPATPQEYDLASLLEWPSSGKPLDAHPLFNQSAAFGRGVELTTSRSSKLFTRFDGNLAGVVTREGVRTEVVSPTRLQDWAACPHKYLMRHVLGVTEIEHPDTLLQISAIDRGNVMHAAIDEFLTARLDSSGPTGAGHIYTDADKATIRDIAAARLDALDKRGLVGKQLFWRRDRETILTDLACLLDEDTSRGIRGEVVASEMGFGVPAADHPPVTLDLGNGNTISFRGYIDRVERDQFGRLIVVDYKTGGSGAYRNLNQENPDDRGVRLQLPVYALAARQAMGDQDTSVHAAYWFITRDPGAWQWVGLELDEAVNNRFRDVVQLITEGITSGVFPARPTDQGNPTFVDCPYCDPDGLGARERLDEWERKRDAPGLAGYRSLADPEIVPHG